MTPAGNDDRQDRLLDTLLEEVLGDRTPPNCTARILARARARRWRARLLLVPLAAAATVLAVLAGRHLLPGGAHPPPASLPPRCGGEVAQAPQPATTEPDGRREALERGVDVPPYPQPILTRCEGRLEAVERGVTVIAESVPQRLELGGYCRITLDPHSVVTVAGAPLAESIFLKQGGVECEVDRRIGAFTVETEIATLTVMGTKFSARLSATQTAQNALERKREMSKTDTTKTTTLALAVAVMAGTVHVAWADGERVLAPGESQVVQVRTAGAGVAATPVNNEQKLRVRGKLTRETKTITDQAGQNPREVAFYYIVVKNGADRVRAIPSGNVDLAPFVDKMVLATGADWRQADGAQGAIKITAIQEGVQKEITKWRRGLRDGAGQRRPGRRSLPQTCGRGKSPDTHKPWTVDLRP